MTQDRDRKALDIQTIPFLFFRRVPVEYTLLPTKLWWFWLSYSNLTWPHFHDYLVDQKGILGNSWAHVVYSQVGEIWKILQLTSIHPYLKQLDWLDGARKGSKRKIFCCCMARCSMSCWWAPIPLMVSEIQSMHKFETPLQVRVKLMDIWTFPFKGVKLKQQEVFLFFEVGGYRELSQRV